MESHLPAEVLSKLQAVVAGLDEGLQASSYKIGQAMEVDHAFDRSYVDSPLLRALVCSIASNLNVNGVRVEQFGNGGCEIRIAHGDTDRWFRLKKASRDKYGHLDVRASSDSFLTRRARSNQLSLLDDDIVRDATTHEQWVLPYLLHPITRTFTEFFAALPVGTVNEHAPFRLILDHVVGLGLPNHTPDRFQGSLDDLDLDLGFDFGEEGEGGTADGAS